jgi:hypothetical protein
MELGLGGAFVETPNGTSTACFDFAWLQQWNAISTGIGRNVSTQF